MHNTRIHAAEKRLKDALLSSGIDPYRPQYYGRSNLTFVFGIAAVVAVSVIALFMGMLFMLGTQTEAIFETANKFPVIAAIIGVLITGLGVVRISINK